MAGSRWRPDCRTSDIRAGPPRICSGRHTPARAGDDRSAAKGRYRRPSIQAAGEGGLHTRFLAVVSARIGQKRQEGTFGLSALAIALVDAT